MWLPTLISSEKDFPCLRLVIQTLLTIFSEMTATRQFAKLKAAGLFSYPIPLLRFFSSRITKLLNEKFGKTDTLRFRTGRSGHVVPSNGKRL